MKRRVYCRLVAPSCCWLQQSVHRRLASYAAPGSKKVGSDRKTDPPTRFVQGMGPETAAGKWEHLRIDPSQTADPRTAPPAVIREGCLRDVNRALFLASNAEYYGSIMMIQLMREAGDLVKEAQKRLDSVGLGDDPIFEERQKKLYDIMDDFNLRNELTTVE